MTQPPPFGQDIGVASAAGRKILLALLAKDQLDFPEWLTMTTLNNEGPRPRDALATRLVALGLDDTEAITRLESRGLLTATPDSITLATTGQALTTASPPRSETSAPNSSTASRPTTSPPPAAYSASTPNAQTWRPGHPVKWPGGRRRFGVCGSCRFRIRTSRRRSRRSGGRLSSHLRNDPSRIRSAHW
jgi:hypothetical protein